MKKRGLFFFFVCVYSCVTSKINAAAEKLINLPIICARVQVRSLFSEHNSCNKFYLLISDSRALLYYSCTTLTVALFISAEYALQSS